MSIDSSIATGLLWNHLHNDNGLSIEQVLFIHDTLINTTGGAHGVRDLSLLVAAVRRPQAGLADRALYPTVHEKAAALLQSLIMNHPFIDGNKRTGITAAAVFLEMNDVYLTASSNELEDFAIHVATQSLSVADIVVWLRQHSDSSS